jgi:hypothetical protein
VTRSGVRGTDALRVTDPRSERSSRFSVFLLITFIVGATLDGLCMLGYVAAT